MELKPDDAAMEPGDVETKPGKRPTQRVPRRRDRLFPKYAHDYFEQLRQQYMLMLENTAAIGPAAGQTVAPPPTIEALIAAYHRNPTSITWSDVFTLETAYLYAIHDDRLQSELLLFRGRYSDVAGTDAFTAYAKTVPADVTTMDVRQLRAELMTLAERLRYLFTFIPPRESTRNWLAGIAGLWTLAAAGMGGLAYSLFKGQIPVFWVVFFIGEMGGFLSVQHRLQKIDVGDPLFRELQLSSGKFSIIVVAPIIGSFFAVLLYFLFVAGLLQGGFFPTFTPFEQPKNTSVSLTDFLTHGVPASVGDWGKLLVWSFIAGFAERFVPGVLARFSGESSASEAEKTLIANTTKPPQHLPRGRNRRGETT